MVACRRVDVDRGGLAGERQQMRLDQAAAGATPVASVRLKKRARIMEAALHNAPREYRVDANAKLELRVNAQQRAGHVVGGTEDGQVRHECVLRHQLTQDIALQ